MSGSISIRLNGEPATLSETSSLDDLVADLKLVPKRIAIELNREVIKRSLWAQTKLKEGDVVEIVHFVGGGFR